MPDILFINIRWTFWPSTIRFQSSHLDNSFGDFTFFVLFLLFILLLYLYFIDAFSCLRHGTAYDAIAKQFALFVINIYFPLYKFILFISCTLNFNCHGNNKNRRQLGNTSNKPAMNEEEKKKLNETKCKEIKSRERKLTFCCMLKLTSYIEKTKRNETTKHLTDETREKNTPMKNWNRSVFYLHPMQINKQCN